MTYPTPAAVDRAIKKAVRASGLDAGAGYRQALRDRFLCRIFADPKERFVLKGGSGMLARIPTARNSRDVDFALQRRISVEETVKALNELASIDMGDWCRFELTRQEISEDVNGYSRLLKLRYATFIGQEEKDPILIDVSLDCHATQPIERLDPANRVFVEGLTTHPYLLYPLEDQLADKLCAIMERQPGGWPSSRMKDLVDVVTYAQNEVFSLNHLSFAIRSECRRRAMSVPESFVAPQEWATAYAPFAKRSGIESEFCNFDTACKLAERFFNPALRESSIESDAIWSPSKTIWEYRE